MSNHESKGPRTSNRDAALERAWRETSAEQPPSHLDAAIIAAARKSVPDGGERPSTAPVRARSRNWLTRWQPLAAAAVVAALAFGLVQQMSPREHELAPSMQWKESAPAPAEPQPQPPPQLQPQRQPQPQPRSSSARERAYTGQEPSANRAASQRERIAVPDSAPSHSAVPAPPTATAAPETTAEATANDTAAKAEATDSDTPPTAGTAAGVREISADRRKAVESAVAGRAATTAAAAPSSRTSEGNLGTATPLDSPAWAAKVAALHASGDVTAAEHALREFRMAVPDADRYLPDSLRSWAQTVE